LIDEAGHRLSTSDENLLRLEQVPAAWPPGSVTHTYHLVTVPPTQMPGPAALQVRLYDETTLVPLRPDDGTPDGAVRIGDVRIMPPQPGRDDGGLSPDQPLAAVLPGDLTLLGLDRIPTAVSPGMPLTLRLYWQADEPLAAEQRFAVTLGESGIRADGLLPVDMPAGSPVHTFVDLRVPPDAEPGAYPARLVLDDPAATPVLLGEVQIQGRTRRFEPPALLLLAPASFGNSVTLLGVAPSEAGESGEGPFQAVAGQPITITLAWQAETTPAADLVRFVHLLPTDDETPLAQNDSRPCAGECLAASWMPGEVLVDTLSLSIPADLPAGSYRLGVGWYDAATLARLPVQDDSGRPMPQDVFILPVELVVT
jgi:hypothetical protein